MKKVLSAVIALAMAVSAGLFFGADKAEAVPAFARQMKMPCKSCHFQHFPKLNAFGRAFKSNGYTDVAVDTIEGDWGTSLPANLNLSWVEKIRYMKKVARDSSPQATGSTRGEFQVPDEGALFFGGRVAEHIGAAIEMTTAVGVDGLSWANGTLVFGHDLESLHTHVGMTIWSTDAQGVFWGKELFNTGVQQGLKGWENRRETMAAVGPIAGDYQGMTWYATHEWFFAALGFAAPGLPGGVDFGSDVGGTYRFAITPPQVLGFDWMVGVYGQYGGSSFGGSSAGNDRTDVSLQANGADFQIQGNVTEGITLEVDGNFLYDTDNPSARNHFDIGGQDYHRYQIGFDLGFLNDRLITKFNYLYTSARATGSVRGDDGWQRKGADVVSLGAYWNIRENVSLRPEISWTVGSDTCAAENNCGMARNQIRQDTQGTVMLFFAF
ncbi:MAG: hypothetical protein HZA01_01265 [Nitrospinae bacterium]|nr:hypothetical protein [Nitrospinota bacterium]